MSKQIYPPDITGTSFAEGGSVLDHNFGKSDPYTLGGVIKQQTITPWVLVYSNPELLQQLGE